MRKNILSVLAALAMTVACSVPAANSSGIVEKMFVPAGVGAVPRALQDKRREIVSVMDFMTKAQIADARTGTPTIDSTSAMQKAFDASLNVEFGGTEYTYKVAGTIRLRSGHNINTRGATIRQYTAQTPIFNCSEKKRITVENSVLIGLGTDYVDSSSSLALGLQCPNSTDVTIRGNRFENFSYSPFYGEGVSNFKYIGNTVKGPGVALLVPGVSRNNTGVTVGGTNILISANQISETGQGLIVAQASKNIIVTANVIHDITAEHGMYFDSGMRNLAVNGNTIRAVYHTGIKVQHYDAVGVEPNTVVISGNSIQGTSIGDCILLNNSAPSGPRLKLRGLTVSGNGCFNIAQDGISVRYVAGGLVSGNSLNSIGRHGVFLSQTEDISVNGNSIRQVQLNGISDDGSSNKVSITANAILDAGRAGVNAGGASSGIFLNAGVGRYIHGNIIKGDPLKMQYGLYIAGGDQSTMTVSGNYFGGAKDYSVRFKTPAEPLLYFGENKIEGDVANDPRPFP